MYRISAISLAAALVAATPFSRSRRVASRSRHGHGPLRPGAELCPMLAGQEPEKHAACWSKPTIAGCVVRRAEAL